MVTEKKTKEEYLNEVNRVMGYGDTLSYELNELGEYVLIYKNSIGCILSMFKIDTKEVIYY